MPKTKSVNQTFFLSWNGPMAYVLGYFAADGCMIKNKRGAHFIEFTSIDEELLKIIQGLLRSNHRISKRRIINTAQKATYRIQIGSKKIFEDLIALGFRPSKSHILPFPDVPKFFIADFIRGYFDGDGHVSVLQRSDRTSRTIQAGFTSGSKKFLLNLHTSLKKYANIQGGSLYYNQGYRLNFSVEDSILLYKFMYQNSDNSFLLRKFETFRNYNLDR